MNSERRIGVFSLPTPSEYNVIESTKNRTRIATKTKSKVRSRPSLFRALGKNDPPEFVQIQGKTFRQVEIFKHDSWAATGVYQHEEEQVVCKFNRQQRIGLLPMKWLGRILARRETILLKRLGELPNVPDWSGEVSLDGQLLKNVVAHVFIPGHPLQYQEHVSDSFFQELSSTLQQVHDRGIAYVDLHKRENVLVSEEGHPFLIDFQIGFWKPKSIIAAASSNWFLKMLQRSDRYHLAKHVKNCRPDQSSEDIQKLRPWFIRLHRFLTIPLRTMRRNLLVMLRIRSKSGQASSETNPEIGHRIIKAAE